jgi:hypothetical protein
MARYERDYDAGWGRNRGRTGRADGFGSAGYDREVLRSRSRGRSYIDHSVSPVSGYRPREHGGFEGMTDTGWGYVFVDDTDEPIQHYGAHRRAGYGSGSQGGGYGAYGRGRTGPGYTAGGAPYRGGPLRGYDRGTGSSYGPRPGYGRGAGGRGWERGEGMRGANRFGAGDRGQYGPEYERGYDRDLGDRVREGWDDLRQGAGNLFRRNR